METYEELLKLAKEKLPKTYEGIDRFQIPQANVAVIGRQTFIKNFSEIAKALRRNPQHVAKFLFKELAAPGSIKGDELLLQGKVSPVIIRQRIEEYTKEFVICQECGKPDTNLVKSDRLFALKCEACGAKKAMRTI